MQNQCIHCSSVFEDGARETLQGCSKCGSKFFFFMTAEKMLKIQQARGGAGGVQNNQNTQSNVANPLAELTAEDKKSMEQDVRDIAGIKEADAPVILDFETVKITGPGKYILDVPNLFSKKRPLVYKLEDGKYIIDLSSAVKKDKNNA